MKPSEPPTSRIDRRRLRQRALLLWSAIELMGAKGVDGAGIADLTERADMATGSFYSYFPSREALLDAIEIELMRAWQACVAESLKPLPDPRERLTAGLVHNLQRVTDIPAWGRFVTRNGLWLAERGCGPRHVLDADIRAAFERGLIACDPILASMTSSGLLFVAMARILDAAAALPPLPRLAAHLLQCLGVLAEDARAIAGRPLPALTVPPSLVPPLLQSPAA